MFYLIDYVISLLFRRESSILNFLRVNVYTKDPVVKAAQNTLLDFLVSLFHKAKSTMKPYLRSIEVKHSRRKGTSSHAPSSSSFL